MENVQKGHGMISKTSEIITWQMKTFNKAQRTQWNSNSWMEMGDTFQTAAVSQERNRYAILMRIL